MDERAGREEEEGGGGRKRVMAAAVALAAAAAAALLVGGWTAMHVRGDVQIRLCQEWRKAREQHVCLSYRLHNIT